MSSVVNNDLDDIFMKIAKPLYKRLDISNLGKALGCDDGDIGRAIDENAKQGGNFMGTVDLLRTWRKGQTPSTEKAALRSVLVAAGLDNLAVLYLSIPVTELLVPQASSVESGKHPTVFLSYQWDHQLEVIAIKEHLEDNGFPCWMDIGQMGPGDKLSDSIYEGMKSSKVVLCMVTEKYSTSKNCKLEVELAKDLKKTIIPVRIERTDWPLKSPMSVHFLTMLYIDFFNEKEYKRGTKFWEDAKFLQLLRQISKLATPNESMVSDEQHPRPTPAAEWKDNDGSMENLNAALKEADLKELVP